MYLLAFFTSTVMPCVCGPEGASPQTGVGIHCVQCSLALWAGRERTGCERGVAGQNWGPPILLRYSSSSSHSQCLIACNWAHLLTADPTHWGRRTLNVHGLTTWVLNRFLILKKRLWELYWLVWQIPPVAIYWALLLELSFNPQWEFSLEPRICISYSLYLNTF